MHSFLSVIKSLTLALVFTLGIMTLHAWVGPTAPPPGSNVPAPLNVGGLGQAKVGGLILNTGGAGIGLVVANGQTRLGDVAVGGTANVEVGAIVPGNKNAYIDFRGDDTYTDYGLRLIRGNTGADALSALQHRGTGELRIQTVEAAPIRLLTSSAERMRITPTGDVGIGTLAPTAKLEVAGQVKISGGAPGVGKMLISDATGLATWETISIPPAIPPLNVSCPPGEVLQGISNGAPQCITLAGTGGNAPCAPAAVSYTVPACINPPLIVTGSCGSAVNGQIISCTCTGVSEGPGSVFPQYMSGTISAQCVNGAYQTMSQNCYDGAGGFYVACFR